MVPHEGNAIAMPSTRRLPATERRLDLAGAVVGVLAVLVALTPSLLPRPNWAQGLVCGLAFAVGYGVGVGLWRLAMALSQGRLRRTAEARWWIVTLVGIAGVAALMPLAVEWQNSVREAVGETPTSGFDWLVGAAFYAIGATLAFSIGRGVARGWRALHRLAVRWIPGDRSRRRARVIDRLATAAGMLIVASVALSVLSLLLTTLSVQRNRAYDPEFPQPVSALRSGSEASLVEWDWVGQAGAKIVGGGPTASSHAPRRSPP